MEQERLLLIKENQKHKDEKMQVENENKGNKERLEQFEKHLVALRDEIKSSQMSYKKIIEERDAKIEEQRADMAQLLQDK